MSSNAFLTDRRREFLDGDYDLDNPADRQIKHQIKKDAQAAIEELTEVAESPHIDTTEVFDPDDVFFLLRAIMGPDPKHTEGGGVFGGRNHEEYQEENPDVALDVDDDFLAYQDRLYVQLDKLMASHRE